MKLAIFSFLLLFSSPAFSWGYGGAEGKNRLGQIIHFSESSDGVSFDIWVENPKLKPENYLFFKMEAECPSLIKWLDITSPQSNERPIIQCRADGKSPLAGATYTKVRSKKIMNTCGDPATIFKCTKGCRNKSVPLLIIESPWEC